VHSLSEALEKSQETNISNEVFIIGGEKIYDLAAVVANKIYLTLVKTQIEGDAYFNVTPYLNWKQIAKTEYSKDEKNEYDFEILELEKV
jgi:dihydrofolate reductase